MAFENCIWFLPHPNTRVTIVATIATAVVTPTVHRFNFNAFDGFSNGLLRVPVKKVPLRGPEKLVKKKLLFIWW